MVDDMITTCKERSFKYAHKLICASYRMLIKVIHSNLRQFVGNTFQTCGRRGRGPGTPPPGR